MFSFLRKKRHKNSKWLYYLKGYLCYYTPRWICRRRLPHLLARLNGKDRDNILQRVDYYCKLHQVTPLPDDAAPLSSHTLKNKRGGSVYFFDTYEVTRYFKQTLRWLMKPGDVTAVPAAPTIVKSRPVQGDNANAVLLKLNKVRHFFFVDDPIPFAQKEHKIVFRGDANGKPGRIRFFERWFGHPLCDLVDTASHSVNPAEWKGEGMSVEAHLNYRYILALEGVDVASNLKWVMSSNCIAVMPRPTYETWFMEGTLIPDYHYIEIKPDYSDLLERTQYYTDHPDEAEAIIRHAHEYVEQFRDHKREQLVSLLVMDKYFRMTGQESVAECARTKSENEE